MIITKNKRIKEKLRWFQILTSLHEIAVPHIRAFTEYEFQVQGELEADLGKVGKNDRVLRQLLAVIRNLPEYAELKSGIEQWERSNITRQLTGYLIE